jgi:opacity protein-like surface antigen
MRSLTHLFAATAALIIAAPLAQAGGLYVKAAALYNRPGDVEVNNVRAFKASLKNNTGFSAAVGYKFSLLRAEAELQSLRNGTETDETSGTLFTGIGRTGGSVKETSGYANAYFDFPAFFGLSPYLGAGLGFARVNLDNLARTSNNTPVLQYSGSDSVFGYQGMLGLQFHIFGQATINAGYRIVKHQDIAVRDVLANARQNVKFGDNQMFELGFALGF